MVGYENLTLDTVLSGHHLGEFRAGLESLSRRALFIYNNPQPKDQRHYKFSAEDENAWAEVCEGYRLGPEDFRAENAVYRRILKSVRDCASLSYDQLCDSLGVLAEDEEDSDPYETTFNLSANDVDAINNMYERAAGDKVVELYQECQAAASGDINQMMIIAWNDRVDTEWSAEDDSGIPIMGSLYLLEHLLLSAEMRSVTSCRKPFDRMRLWSIADEYHAQAAMKAGMYNESVCEFTLQEDLVVPVFARQYERLSFDQRQDFTLDLKRRLCTIAMNTGLPLQHLEYHETPFEPIWWL